MQSLKDDCSLSGSKADDSSDSVSDSEMESTGDPEPYRFFGLKLEKCDLGGVRIGIEEVHQLEKHRVLPDEYIEDIKSKIRKDTTISALKLTLLLLTKCYCEKPLKEGWLEMLFSKPGSVDCQSSLRKGKYFLFFKSILRENIVKFNAKTLTICARKFYQEREC